jgi:hypothetical protein
MGQWCLLWKAFMQFGVLNDEEMKIEHTNASSMVVDLGPKRTEIQYQNRCDNLRCELIRYTAKWNSEDKLGEVESAKIRIKPRFSSEIYPKYTPR